MRGTCPSTSIIALTDEPPYPSVKTVPGRDCNEQRSSQVEPPRRISRMREASQEDVLASARHFFASVNGQNQLVTLELSEEVPTATAEGATTITSTIPTTSATTTVIGTGAGSPRAFFLMDNFLDPPQQPLADHKHGYNMFQRVQQMVLSQMALALQRVVYLDLHCWKKGFQRI